MDLWVVAAAAGVGYIAKNLQNLSLDKKESLWEPSLKYSVNVQSESWNFLQQIRDKTCPLRRLEQTRAQDDDLDAKFSAIDGLGKRDSVTDVASTSSILGVETLEFEDGESKNIGRLNKGKFNRSRRRSLNYLRPLISLENCLDDELSKESERMEQNVFSMFPSVSTVRPLLVTDGTGMISRSTSNSSLVQFEGGGEEGRRENSVGSKVRNTLLRSTSLEQSDSVELQRKPKKISGIAQKNDSADGVSGRTFHSSGHDGMLLFIIGMTIGILSATTASKNEVDNLNKQLKQTQNLVQDLHEELDMKAMMTVKELVNEDYQPPGENDTPLSIKEPIASPSDVEVKKWTKFDSLKANNKNAENPEVLCKIEEELQAELEMLEHNMNASALASISNVVELDPDFEPDIARGDLKAMMANETRDEASESGNESTDTATNCSQPANYAVPPWELSFRLHELIESRLEARIKELEIALSNSLNRNRVQVLGSQSNLSGRRLSYSETKYSCSPQSPTCISEHNTTDGSLAKNFSSNSLNSCKEANEILVRVTDNDQERGDEKYSSHGIDHEMHSTVRKIINDLFNAEKTSIPDHSVVMEEDGAPDLGQDMPWTLDGQTSRSLMSNEDCESEVEATDESEMLLIKRIVERRRSDSSFIFNFDGL